MRQWIRDISLVVGKEGGEGLEMAGLKIKFDITKTSTEAPNKGQITIWNLSDDTREKLKKEFNTVVLSAGYVDGGPGLIYRGNITNAIFRSENGGIDKMTTLYLGDGDEAYQYAKVNTTLAAGATQQDILDKIMPEMEKHGVTLGSVPDNLAQLTLPRGKVLYKPARDALRDLCRTVGCTYSIQDGVLNIVPITKALDGEAILVSPDTGLVEPGPEQTNEGVKFTCLLNADIKVDGKIKLEAEIDEAAPSAPSKEGGEKKAPAKLAPDGVYRVVEVQYLGDTRANEWYCKVTGVAMDSSGGKTSD